MDPRTIDNKIEETNLAVVVVAGIGGVMAAVKAAKVIGDRVEVVDALVVLVGHVLARVVPAAVHRHLDQLAALDPGPAAHQLEPLQVHHLSNRPKRGVGGV